MIDENNADVITYYGEVAISGSISFSNHGSDLPQLKEELQEFIADHWSDSDQWQNAELSEEEKAQGIVWKMAHKHSKQDTAVIRSKWVEKLTP